jgi:homoserine dehydrogenase
VVTANKALLAERGPELLALAARKGLGLYYEASVAGGIPIVQTLKEGLAGNRIKSIAGILNGTANYILTEMTGSKTDFAEALSKAQAKGYAEADPTLDIEGVDAAHKLVLLIRLAYGQDYPMSRLPVTGITKVTPLDIEMAAKFGYRIKLIGQVREKSGHLEAGVFPALIKESHILAGVDGPFNAILVDGNAVGQVMLYGRGAGDLPTGSAVIADIMALCREGMLPNNTGFGDAPYAEAAILDPALTSSKYYFRFSVNDRPGVLSEVAGVMGHRNISIAQVVQMGNVHGKTVPIVFLSHEAQEANVRAALEEIDAFSFITAPTVRFRIF